MTTQAIPKLLFINEDTEQLIDKRFSRQQIIEESKDKQIIKKWKYKFRSEIPLPAEYEVAEQGEKENEEGEAEGEEMGGIFNVVYCNRYGKMLYNSKKGIAMYTLEQMESMVKESKNLIPTIVIGVTGSLFLSPKQTRLLIINPQQIYTYSLQGKLALVSKTENKYQVTNACWENENDVYLWSFQNKVYRYGSGKREYGEIGSVEKCTGVNRIGDTRIAILEGVQLYIFEQGIKSKTIDLSQKNSQEVLFQFMCLIGITKITNLSSQQLTADDIYLLVGVYYTEYAEGDDTPCARNVFFLKGDLFNEDSIQVRGSQLVFTLNDKEKYYLKEDQMTRLPFSCVFSVMENFVVFLVDKIQFLYFIDSTQKFQKLNIYSTWPKHGFKIPSNFPLKPNKFLKGMATIRNMLPFEREAGPDNISKLYCNKEFNGEFLRLYFADKEADITIEFPVSIVGFSGQYMIRKWAACTVHHSEDDKDQGILSFVKETKKSRYVQTVDKKIKIQPTKAIQKKPSKIEEKKKIQQNVQQKAVEKKSEQNSEPKKQSFSESKDETLSLEKMNLDDTKKTQQQKQQPKVQKPQEKVQKQQPSPIKFTPTQNPQPQPQKSSPEKPLGSIFSFQKPQAQQKPPGGMFSLSKQLELKQPENKIFGSNPFKGQSLFKQQQKPEQAKPADKPGENKSQAGIFGGTGLSFGLGTIFGGGGFGVGGGTATPLFGNPIKKDEKDHSLGKDTKVEQNKNQMKFADSTKPISGQGSTPGLAFGSLGGGSIFGGPIFGGPKTQPSKVPLPVVTEIKQTPTNPPLFKPATQQTKPFGSLAGQAAFGLSSATATTAGTTKQTTSGGLFSGATFTSATMTPWATTTGQTSGATSATTAISSGLFGASSATATTAASGLKIDFGGKPTVPLKQMQNQKQKLITGLMDSAKQLQRPITAIKKPSTTATTPASSSTEQRVKKLKQKLQYFVKQSKAVKDKIDLYVSDEKTPELFNLKNAKDLVKNWNKIFDAPYQKSFDQIGNVMKKMDKFEKYKKARIMKPMNQQKQKKQLTKKCESLEQILEALCYFIAYFDVNDIQKQSSIFGPALKRPQKDSKKQEEKFMSALAKRVKQLQRLSETLKHKHKHNLAQQLKIARRSSKLVRHHYKFDLLELSSSSHNDSQESDDENSIIRKFQLERQKKRQQEQQIARAKSRGFVFTVNDIEQSLEKHQQVVMYNEQLKPMFKYSVLEEIPKEKEPERKVSDVPLKESKEAKKEISLSKTFDSRLANIGLKKQEKKTIPNLAKANVKKISQFIDSQKAESEEQDNVPQIAARTVSKVPGLGLGSLGQKKKQPESGIFGQAKAKNEISSSKETKKQEKNASLFGSQKPKQSTLPVFSIKKQQKLAQKVQKKQVTSFGLIQGPPTTTATSPSVTTAQPKKQTKPSAGLFNFGAESTVFGAGILGDSKKQGEKPKQTKQSFSGGLFGPPKTNSAPLTAPTVSPLSVPKQESKKPQAKNTAGEGTFSNTSLFSGGAKKQQSTGAPKQPLMGSLFTNPATTTTTATTSAKPDQTKNQIAAGILPPPSTTNAPTIAVQIKPITATTAPPTITTVPATEVPKKGQTSDSNVLTGGGSPLSIGAPPRQEESLFNKDTPPYKSEASGAISGGVVEKKSEVQVTQNQQKSVAPASNPAPITTTTTTNNAVFGSGNLFNKKDNTSSSTTTNLFNNNNNTNTSSNFSQSSTATTQIFGQQAQSQTNNNSNIFNNSAPNPIPQSNQFPGHASTSFGSGNRFMTNNAPNMGSTQGQQQQGMGGGFNPNEMKFGAGTTGGGLKSFTNIGSNATNPFNQGQQQPGQQAQSWLNAGSSSGGGWLNNAVQQQQPQQQTSWLNTAQTQSTNMFNSPQQQQGNQPWNTSGQSNNTPWIQQQPQQQQQQQTGFDTFQMGGQMGGVPAGVNPALMQPRK